MKQVLLKKGVLTFIINEGQNNADKYVKEHTIRLKLGFVNSRPRDFGVVKL